MHPAEACKHCGRFFSYVDIPSVGIAVSNSMASKVRGSAVKLNLNSSAGRILLGSRWISMDFELR
jgi:hypothetical protein